jgi:hypothetical protein
VVVGALHGEHGRTAYPEVAEVRFVAYLEHDIDRAIIIDFDLHHGMSKPHRLDGEIG